MLKEFQSFLIKDNALALAVGVIIGGAMGKLVGSITSDLIMPVAAIFIPKDTQWENWGFTLVREGNVVKVGAFLSAIMNLLIVGFVCFLLVKIFVKEQKKA